MSFHSAEKTTKLDGFVAFSAECGAPRDQSLFFLKKCEVAANIWLKRRLV